jgi:hypothetical protein
MNYELAKQLKEAGFPETDCLCGSDYGDHPSLSELIEACGDNHFELERDWFNGTDKWRALYWFEGNVKSGFGSTPEEAVAKLWIALNKK